MYGTTDVIQDLERKVRFYRVVSGILAVLLFLACFIGLSREADARPSPDVKERCDTPIPLTFIQCVTYGEHWVYIGTAGNDRIVGTEWPEIIHSGRGADYVDGGRGPGDVCYVQPRDTVKRCE